MDGSKDNLMIQLINFLLKHNEEPKSFILLLRRNVFSGALKAHESLNVAQ